MYQKRKAVENLLVLCSDLAALFLSFCIAVAIRYGTFSWREAYGDQRQQIIVIITLYSAINMFTNYYSTFFARGKIDELYAVLREEIIFFVMLVVALYLIHPSDSVSRLLMIYFFLVNTLLMYLFRFILKAYMFRVYKNGRYGHLLFLVSRSGEAEKIVPRLLSKLEADWNRTLAGVILTDRESGGGSIAQIPVVAGSEDMLDYIVHNDVDEVLFSWRGVEEDETARELINEIQMMGIQVDVNIETFNLVRHGTKTLDKVGDYSVVAFSRNVISTRGAIAKRTMDIIGGLIGMVLFGITALFAVPAIRLESPGPAIFSQIRVGKNGRRFRLYKFRSMYMDAEEKKKELLEQNEVNGLMFKIGDDPRITKVGRFLRRTSLDEMPQFWNILKGDMSLVGTRPPTVDEFEQYEAKHKARLSMTPGLTGYWQISGRSDIKDFDEVVRLDMQYIDHWSIGLDLKILIKTVIVVLTGKGSE